MKYSLRFSIRNFFLREISFLGRQRFMTLLFYEAVLTVGLSFKLFRAYRNNETVVFHHKCAIPRSGFDIVLLYI